MNIKWKMGIVYFLVYTPFNLLIKLGIDHVHLTPMVVMKTVIESLIAAVITIIGLSLYEARLNKKNANKNTDKIAR